MVRHGRTALNNPSSPRLRGWEDIELSDEGRIDVQLQAHKLRFFQPKYIYHSDFMRDSETGAIIGSILGIPTETDYDLRTWDVGNFSGKTEEEANPQIINIYKQPWNKPPGSNETFNDFSRRSLGAVEKRLEQAAIGEHLRPTIIVTHGRNIALMHAHVTGIPEWEASMPMPAGIAVISVAEDGELQFDLRGETEPVLVDA